MKIVSQTSILRVDSLRDQEWAIVHDSGAWSGAILFISLDEVIVFHPHRLPCRFSKRHFGKTTVLRLVPGTKLEHVIQDPNDFNADGTPK